MINIREFDLETVIENGGTMIIGRASSSNCLRKQNSRKEQSNNLLFREKTVSKTHCYLYVQRIDENNDYSVVISDAKSQHGTVLNKKPLWHIGTDLKNGDIIGLVVSTIRDGVTKCKIELVYERIGDRITFSKLQGTKNTGIVDSKKRSFEEVDYKRDPEKDESEDKQELQVEHKRKRFRIIDQEHNNSSIIKRATIAGTIGAVIGAGLTFTTLVYYGKML
ncbi:hypothetical protein WICMUC_004531 [Wickerhamomyces mucosus]|uniref:FHA domain-containing protein n=1 Tax=Wickerhamomyces mucosus TaxID=1378264 RepID=A0A9P8PGI1_9ASCO|nr:hypothetical protein WICMUC_004531 [Wickerhamomyces mucosus]